MDYPFADRDLSRRLERAEGATGRRFVEARARVSPNVGACWIEAGGALAMFDGPSSPITQTFGLGIGETPTATHLATLEAFFRDRGAPVHHETSPLADPALFPLLVERGYHPVEFTSVMYREIARDVELAPSNSAMVVRRVEGDILDRWARTAADGWRSEGANLGEFILEISRLQRVMDDAYQFLAELDGEPVAAGSLSIHDGIGLLAGASTIPSGRRRGAQLALLDARLRFAAERGCDLLMMCALPGSGSQRNAERHGFRIAYTRVKWFLR